MVPFNIIENNLRLLLGEFSKKLSVTDLKNISILIEHNEFGEALEILCTQLYEYDIAIGSQQYLIIEQTAKTMKMSEDRWIYTKELLGESSRTLLAI